MVDDRPLDREEWWHSLALGRLGCDMEGTSHMRTRRSVLFLGALALALAPASAASAKPVSTYTISVVVSSTNTVAISLSETGEGSFSLREIQTQSTTCEDGSQGSVLVRLLADQNVADVEFAVDRKMNTATATASGFVDRTTVDSCTGETVVEQVPWNVTMSATATARPDRGRNADGDRQIRRDADVTFGYALRSGTAMNGAITETISK